MFETLPQLKGLESQLESAARQACAAGVEIHKAWLYKTPVASSKGSELDLVTEVDVEAEHAICAVLKQFRPEDAIVSEEGDGQHGHSGFIWYIDPLDGTKNFVNRHPFHAVAIGLEYKGKPVLGIVHDTHHDKNYFGAAWQKARGDDQPLILGSKKSLNTALVGTGFPPAKQARLQIGQLLAKILPDVLDIRRSGCPAMDFCAVAAGQLDLYYEFGLMPWDISAGRAVVLAAGGVVTLGQETDFPEPLVVAGNRILVEAFTRTLQAKITEDV